MCTQIQPITAIGIKCRCTVRCLKLTPVCNVCKCPHNNILKLLIQYLHFYLPIQLQYLRLLSLPLLILGSVDCRVVGSSSSRYRGIELGLDCIWCDGHSHHHQAIPHDRGPTNSFDLSVYIRYVAQYKEELLYLQTILLYYFDEIILDLWHSREKRMLSDHH